MKKSSKIFVGMDVHKESIDIALAEPAGEVRRWGQIGGERAALAKAVLKLESLGGELHFVYEAGPCGFWIERRIRARGHDCWVVSPSSVPKKSGERIKTDRRDSEKLAPEGSGHYLIVVSRALRLARARDERRNRA